LKFKNTFYNWLTNRFILIIRNEENFAIRSTYRFTNIKLIVLGISAFLIVFFFSVYLISTVLAKWFNPEYAQLEIAKRTIILSSKVDSLSYELDRKDQYINRFKMLVTGDIVKLNEDNIKNNNFEHGSSVVNAGISPEDSILRAKFENEDLASELIDNIFAFDGVAFYTPVEGILKTKFSKPENNKGVELYTTTGMPVVAMVDGVVIHHSSYKENHLVMVGSSKLNLIVKYIFEGKISVREGNVLKGGDVIGIIGESDLPVLGIETWLDSRIVNPEYFVSF